MYWQTLSICFYLEHSNEDFQFNNPIMSKKKSSTNPGAKHRKSSEDRSTGKPIKKASTAAATLQVGFLRCCQVVTVAL